MEDENKMVARGKVIDGRRIVGVDFAEQSAANMAIHWCLEQLVMTLGMAGYDISTLEITCNYDTGRSDSLDRFNTILVSE